MEVIDMQYCSIASHLEAIFNRTADLTAKMWLHYNYLIAIENRGIYDNKYCTSWKFKRDQNS